MSKIIKLIKAINILLKKPYLFNKVLSDDGEHKEQVIRANSQMEKGFPLVDLLDLIPNFNETITPFSFLNGGSLPTDIALLKGLCKQKEDCTYFEIGTWRGESVCNVAQKAKTCYTLNLSDDELIRLGYQEEYLNQQGFYSKEIDNIVHLKGNSFDFDFSPYYNKCDLVFIDGDHRYESVVNDTKIAFKLLKDEHSIIVWHDYSSHPGKIRWEVLRGIFDGTPTVKKSKLHAISNTLCAIYSAKKLPTIVEKLSPNKVFNLNIKAEKISN